jgi:hypothetical protein
MFNYLTFLSQIKYKAILLFSINFFQKHFIPFLNALNFLLKIVNIILPYFLNFILQNKGNISHAVGQLFHQLHKSILIVILGGL